MTSQAGKRGDSPSPALSVDIERVLCDLNRSFNPLHRDFLLDFHVSGTRNGYVYLSIAMPEGMTRVFVTLLESLHGFFRFIDRKTWMASVEEKSVDPEELEKRHQLKEKFQAEVCSLFDSFVGQGLEQKEAVKRTNAALKAKKHPWANHATVSSVLRAAGRFRTKRRR